MKNELVRKFSLIFGFGSMGGFGYWMYNIYSTLINDSPLPPNIFWVLLISLFLGGISALIGVHYIYTEKIENQTKALIVGLVFGLSFNTVISSLSTEKKLQERTNEVATLHQSMVELARLDDASTVTQSENQSKKIKARSQRARILVRAIPKNDTGEAREAVVNTTVQILDGIQTASRESPASSAEAVNEIEQIGVAAARVEPRIAERSAQAIFSISEKRSAEASEIGEKIETVEKAEKNLRNIQLEAAEADREELAKKVFAKRVQLIQPLIKEPELLIPEEKLRLQSIVKDLNANAPTQEAKEALPQIE